MSGRPRFWYFLATEMTKRRLRLTSSWSASWIARADLPRELDLLVALEQRIGADLVEILVENVALGLARSDPGGAARRRRRLTSVIVEYASDDCREVVMLMMRVRRRMRSDRLSRLRPDAQRDALRALSARQKALQDTGRYGVSPDLICLTSTIPLAITSRFLADVSWPSGVPGA